MKPTTISSIITLAGSAGFVCIVTYLQYIQGGYSSVNQLMSELALGEKGSLMLFAFLLFALAVAGAAGLMTICQASLVTRVLLVGASLSLAGAGIFKLGAATTIHVALVAIAFILLGLVMYLSPRHTKSLQNTQGRVVCWGLGAGTVLAVALGNNLLPIGIGQRLAAGCILLWLCWLAIVVQKQGGARGA